MPCARTFHGLIFRQHELVRNETSVPRLPPSFTAEPQIQHGVNESFIRKP